MRVSVPIAAFVILAGPAFAQTLEKNTHRFGATYATPPASSARSCAAQCASDHQCVAWTYLRAIAASPARCELKLSEGRPEHNPLAVSGLSASAPNLAKLQDASLRRDEPALAEAPPLPRHYVSAMAGLKAFSRPQPVKALPAQSAPTPKPANVAKRAVQQRIIPLGDLPVIRHSEAPVRGAPKPLVPKTQTEPQASPAAPVASVAAQRVLSQEEIARLAPASNPSEYYPHGSNAQNEPPEDDTSDYYQRRPAKPATPVAPTSISHSPVRISPPPPAFVASAKTTAGTRIISDTPKVASNSQATALRGAMKP